MLEYVNIIMFMELISPLLQRKFFSFRDIAFFSCLALGLAAASWLTRQDTADEKYAEITVDGQVTETVPLALDGTRSPAGRPGVRISVRGGKVGFINSDCPDKICVHTGFLSIPGQLAVCLPNRVVVRVTSKGKVDGLDSVSY
jgi:hypothetical protein